MIFTKQLTSLLLIAVMVFTFVGSGCDSKATIDQLAGWNVRLAGLTADLGASLNRAVGEGRLSPQKGQQAAKALQVVINGGKAATAALNEILKKYPTGEIPQAELKGLFTDFSDIVIKPIKVLLTQFDLATGEDLDYLSLAVNALRSFISEISRRLKKSGVPEAAYLYNTLSGKELNNV
jgi:outer membrane murein-binding lipoprotein Lpp